MCDYYHSNIFGWHIRPVLLHPQFNGASSPPMWSGAEVVQLPVRNLRPAAAATAHGWQPGGLESHMVVVARSGGVDHALLSYMVWSGACDCLRSSDGTSQPVAAVKRCGCRCRGSAASCRPVIGACHPSSQSRCCVHRKQSTQVAGW